VSSHLLIYQREGERDLRGRSSSGKARKTIYLPSCKSLLWTQSVVLRCRYLYSALSAQKEPSYTLAEFYARIHVFYWHSLSMTHNSTRLVLVSLVIKVKMIYGRTSVTPRLSEPLFTLLHPGPLIRSFRRITYRVI
jgi:hypothetical protein